MGTSVLQIEDGAVVTGALRFVDDRVLVAAIVLKKE
jgi:CO/xanthine dehydrogenase Mo-binding subunit